MRSLEFVTQEEDKIIYKSNMSKKDGYKIRNKEGIHFITFAVVEWVDVFTRKEYRDIVLDSIQ